jgi:hypothetical protein
MDERYGARGTRYDLRPRKERDYSHLFATAEDDSRLSTTAEVDEPLATPQMGMKKGIKMFGQEG